jgi:3-hydroxyacyl-CoA dehydrogenase/enoyl-CoA hydratase/3-hydroxybutyryl-CoA epimerase
VSDTIRGLHWDQDADGIVTVTMDDPDQSVNTMNDTWVAGLHAMVARLEAGRDAITGVVLASAKKTFFAGGDLNLLAQGSPDVARQQTEHINGIKAQFRRIEKLGRPVVAVIDGSALGGGLEVALMTHHRIAVNRGDIRVGVPEVTFGLLPGGGGVTRLVRSLGLHTALTEWILTGTAYTARDAAAKGIIDELVGSAAELIPAAKAWIKANPGAVQPWDVPGYQVPGGSANSPKVAPLLPAYAANLRKQAKGAPLAAPRAALAAAVEGTLVDFDTANLIETRYLVSLICGQVAKNMIGVFFDTQKVNGGDSRPDGYPPFAARKVGVIGAGMMGAAIAYVCARSGIEVVLKDVSQQAADNGKGYAERRQARAVEQGKTTAEQAAELLARITPTSDPAAFAGVDFVIEAVYESHPLKQRVFQEIQDIAAPGAVLGSNTSTLPITLLAEGVERPSDFIGIHFFSPVDKMALVEIIVGKQTADATLAKVFDFVRQIRKTPIVVNDRRGFFTSRVIGKFIDEGVAAVGEGVEPARVEQAAMQAGYPTGPLQLMDELTLSLPRKIRAETKAAVQAEGGEWRAHGSEAVIDAMLDTHGRAGRSSGAGFYSYDESGRRTHLWPGLRASFGSGGADVPLKDLQERMLFAEAIETVRCLDEGVLRSVADANVGSIQGIGFPAWTGGVLQYVRQYEGGLPGFVARCRELAERYGSHLEPPTSLVELAASGGWFE